MTFEEIQNISGADLDYQVALLEGLKPVIKDGSCFIPVTEHFEPYGIGGLLQAYKTYSPSKNWADGGPIIERERMVVYPVKTSDKWVSSGNKVRNPIIYGDSPLIAAMRCYLSLKIEKK